MNRVLKIAERLKRGELALAPVGDGLKLIEIG